MSLKLLQPGTEPLGQFDGHDNETLTFKGGEVCSFAAVLTNTQPGVTTSGLDQAAYDVFDGYVQTGAGVYTRPAVSKNWLLTNSALPVVQYPLVPAAANASNGFAGATRPFFLADDGILGYGTLFGAVVGGTVGQQVNGPNSYTGAVLGPHTATGSGKVTLWDKPGLYAVSLDAVDGYLSPSNLSLVVGTPLSFTAGSSSTISGGGLLTPANLANFGAPTTGAGPIGGAVAGANPVVATFIEFNTNGSLVTTPNYLVAALNSPSGNVSSVQNRVFTFATIAFRPYS
jgi:hypothetical protein